MPQKDNEQRDRSDEDEETMTEEELEAEGDWHEPEQPFEIEMQ